MLEFKKKKTKKKTKKKISFAREMIKNDGV